MTLVETWRLENLILCALVGVIFAVQTWHIRRELDASRKILCAFVVLVMLRDTEGTIEQLAQGNPGGPRLFLSSALYLLILAAVVLRKVFRDVGAP